MKIKIMCVGGLKDGQTIALESGCDRFQAHTTKKGLAVPYTPLSYKTDFKVTVYERMLFAGSTDKVHYVMAEQNLSPDDVLSKLIENYSPTEKTKGERQ